jgi:GGDEF domain-containing protein
MEELANADPSATMPAINPTIMKEILKAKAASTKAVVSRKELEKLVEKTGDEAPANQPAAEESRAMPPEALSVEGGAEIGETTKELETEGDARPQPVAEGGPKKSLHADAAKEPIRQATGPALETRPDTEEEPKPKSQTGPQTDPEPAVEEAEEEPPLDFPEDLAIYREPDFVRELKRELSKCRRVERPLTLIMVRITDLEQITEIFGKVYRPKVLMHVAVQVLGALRDVDSVGLLESRERLALTAFASDRYGGERIVARLRKTLRNHPFDVGLGIAGFVPKLIFGMASFPKDAQTVEELLELAEKEIPQQ